MRDTWAARRAARLAAEDAAAAQAEAEAEASAAALSAALSGAVATLTGAAGRDGADGLPGAQGPQGEQGPPGPRVVSIELHRERTKIISPFNGQLMVLPLIVGSTTYWSDGSVTHERVVRDAQGQALELATVG